MEHESLQCDSVASQTWPNTNLSTCCFLWSIPLHISVSLYVYISLFSHPLCRHSLSSAAACSPSLIFPLSLHNSGDQSPVAMAIKPPVQVYALVWFLRSVFVCLPVHRLYLLLTSRSGEASAGDAALLHWTCLLAEWLWQLSGRDALTCHTWLPLSSVQNDDQIQRGKNTHSSVKLILLCFQLKTLLMRRLFIESLKCKWNKKSCAVEEHRRHKTMFSHQKRLSVCRV